MQRNYDPGTPQRTLAQLDEDDEDCRLRATRLSIETELQSVSARVGAVAPGLLDRYPVGEYLEALDRIEPAAPYNYHPPGVRDRCEQIRTVYGQEALDAYHRLIMLGLLSGFEARVERAAIPDSVLSCAIAFRSRLAQDSIRLPDSYYRLENDRFAKDLAFSRLRWLPCGPEFVVIRSGLPRRRLLAPPRWQVPLRIAFVLTRLGGFKPLFETHFDRRLASEFNEDGYRKFYLRLAELLELHSDVGGVVLTGSWFMDPALASISPELDYLREQPVSMGGKLVPVATTRDDVRRATQASPRRREMFDRGEYVPRSFMVLMPRTSLLAAVR